MTANRPSWLREPCPPWCAGDHATQVHPEDFCHESAHDIVPVVVARPARDRVPGDPAPLRTGEATELSVVAFQEVATGETWIALAEEQRFLELSVESARRMHAALARLLARV